MPDHAVVSDFCALRISRTVFSALSGTRLLACLIVAPQRGYDEPGILSYAISSFCPTSADGLQRAPGAPRHSRRTQPCITRLSVASCTRFVRDAERAARPRRPQHGHAALADRLTDRDLE